LAGRDAPASHGQSEKLILLSGPQAADPPCVTHKFCYRAKKIFADPRLATLCDPNDMPFDCKKMARGGFKTLV